MKNICLLFILFLVSTLNTNSREDEYWALVPGSLGQYLVQTDSTTMVLITNEWTFVEQEEAFRPNTLNLHYFNNNGEFINSLSKNFDEIDSFKVIEPLRSNGRVAGRSSMTKLANGKFLLGGHGIQNSTYAKESRALNYYHKRSLNHYKDSVYLQFSSFSEENNVEKEETPPMINPMIFTFNPALDSLLKIDTLEAVPYYGSVVLIREIAPDTLIIGYHKSNESRHEIMETDSLFNVRWKTEFGQIDEYFADIYDFQVASDGNYLVSVHYWNVALNEIYYAKNRLFKFCKNTGELLWEKIIRNDSNISFMFTLTALENDKYLIAYDDCCLGPSGNYLQEYVFHENTGLHLRIIDNDGNTIEQKSLVDFLSAHIYTHGSPGNINYENPDEAVPWYRPLKTVKNPDNTFLISGILRSAASTYYLRGFLLKLDENLEPLWVRVFEIDKKNYIYDCYNTLRLNNILYNGNNIFLGGTFESISSNCPYYDPNYYYVYFWSGILVPLDEYGCHEPDCHLYDNIAEWEYDSLITFFPNPANTTLNVIIDRQEIEQKEKTLFISDLSGRGMLTKHFTGNELQVSINNFSPGVYLAYIFSEGHILKSEKIVVK
ncbi:MAG: T9SS type A sorting domain-containing protein [Bacteroidales bacterium]